MECRVEAGDLRDFGQFRGNKSNPREGLRQMFRIKRQKVWKNLGSWFNGKVAEWVIEKPRGVYLSPYKVIGRDVPGVCPLLPHVEPAELVCTAGINTL